MTVYRPRIFISSTINDFKDLRSSLKYYLDELGYQVLLSEFNDFEKPLDENTIQACIKAIETSDIFVLFIGSKPGGMFSIEKGITITRFEYQNAYELFKQNKIRIVLFVREEVWKLKDDREALSEYLISSLNNKLSPEQIKEIKNHDGPYIKNAELVFNFIDEIARAEEMRKAVEGSADFPKGNWVHSFSNFSEIIDALNIELNIKRDIGKIAREVNLKIELASNTNKIISKTKDGKMFFNFWYSSSIKNELPDSFQPACSLPSKEVIRLCMFTIFSGIGNEFSTQFIDRALEFGDYLLYNKDKGNFEPGEIHKALIDLKTQINQARHFSTNCSQWFAEFEGRYKALADTQSEVLVDSKYLLFILGLSNVLENIFNLSTSIYIALNGKNDYLSKVVLIPSSPFVDEAQEIEKENFSITELQNLLEKMSEKQ
jgi:hypothetical protein